LSGVSLDAGIGKFREMLRYKSIRDGGVYKQVSERNSTQTCSDCGRCRLRSERIGLGVRSWVCDSCGASHDRDVNAARNILSTALKPDSTSALDTKRRTVSGAK
jgi:transposase